ncbi:MAG: hypothetical protein AVDCRST_MAG33-83 [uncultured Thermomicrobiales bacterium]|uniref:Uncharacterized protein n=1 Tax=uncultured Thermomicrobiales bacterium TaxID=1645740 RepID=A0A6J4U785_9BACT|nr:MAG: hypothetical protein AVDCRST_MAG33-83 [uncultured Thermomicrobiales bacterium]
MPRASAVRPFRAAPGFRAGVSPSLPVALPASGRLRALVTPGTGRSYNRDTHRREPTRTGRHHRDGASRADPAQFQQFPRRPGA